MTRSIYARTLTSAPAQPDPAPTDREALHLLDSSLSVRLADELHETAVLADGDLDLSEREWRK